MVYPPSQVQMIIVPQLEKPQGGYRPIGVCSSFYRLWGKLRRVQCDAGELANDRPYFAAASGRGLVDPVWRDGMGAEKAIAEPGGNAAGMLWDSAKFYEHVIHAELVRTGAQLGF